MGTPSYLSEVSICNQALARMGSTQMITSFSDGSNEAAQCAIFYPNDRDAMLSDFPWPWAEAYNSLVQVAGPETTQTRANAQWLRAYVYPVDCLKLRRVVRTPPPLQASGLPQTTGAFGMTYWHNEPWRRAVGDAYPVSYGFGNTGAVELVFSDEYGPYGLTAVYTQSVNDPSIFANDFADALTWRVAADLAMGLGFSAAKREYADKKYEEMVNRARATAMNEMQSDIPRVRWQSEVIRARWGG